MNFFQKLVLFVALFFPLILWSDYRSLEELAEIRRLDQVSYTAFFPGSFDPPHRSHFLAVSELIEKYHFDKVYVVVNTLGPKNYLSSVDERLEMVEAVLAKYGDKISFIKEPMEGKEFLKAQILKESTEKLFGVTGGDGWELLPQSVKDDLNKSWVIMPRPEMNYEDNYPMRDNLFVMRRSDYGEGISSSELRKMLAAGEELSNNIPRETLEVMRRGDLYGIGGLSEEGLQVQYLMELEFFKKLTNSDSHTYPERKAGQSPKAWRENFIRTYAAAQKLSPRETEIFWKSFSNFVNTGKISLKSCLDAARKLLK